MACFCEDFFWFDFGERSPMIVCFLLRIDSPAAFQFLRRERYDAGRTAHCKCLNFGEDNSTLPKITNTDRAIPMFEQEETELTEGSEKLCWLRFLLFDSEVGALIKATISPGVLGCRTPRVVENEIDSPARDAQHCNLSSNRPS
jgi:hypothetical protein